MKTSGLLFCAWYICSVHGSPGSSVLLKMTGFASSGCTVFLCACVWGWGSVTVLHSPAKGHLSWLPGSATGNSPSGSLGELLPFYMMTSFSLEVTQLHCSAIYSLSRNFHLLSTMAVLTHVPSNSTLGLLYSMPCQMLQSLSSLYCPL